MEGAPSTKSKKDEALILIQWECPDLIIPNARMEMLEIQLWNHAVQTGLVVLKALDVYESDDINNLLSNGCWGFEVPNAMFPDLSRDPQGGVEKIPVVPKQGRIGSEHRRRS